MPQRKLSGRGRFVLVLSQRDWGILGLPFVIPLVWERAMDPRLQGQKAIRRWPKFKRVQRQADLFCEMIERVGVAPGAAAKEDFGRAFAIAARLCMSCPHASACRNWLDCDGFESVPDFCRNTAFLLRVSSGGS